MSAMSDNGVERSLICFPSSRAYPSASPKGDVEVTQIGSSYKNELLPGRRFPRSCGLQWRNAELKYESLPQVGKLESSL